MDPRDEIRERLDIAEVIRGHLDLKPAGSGNYKALCPFHGEKTPSLHVSTEKKIWHCFGCGKGGDVFSFVMEMEGMTFPEALKELAKRAGVTLPDKPERRDDKTADLYDVNEFAAKVFEKLLEHPSGEVARAYLEKRAFPKELIEKFRLGFAVDQWSMLLDYMKKQGISEARIAEAGLIKKSEKGNYIDRFRGRIMVPLCDAQGRVVGFTGRILVENDKAPKYLNSPETPIYHKSALLYGLHLAKKAIRTEDAVIIVEGNLDVIASHKAGVEHIVASSGTALTPEHLRILKRHTNNLIFSFDTDSAGFEAAKKGIALAQKEGFAIKVITYAKSDGKDPDEIVRRNPEEWRRLASEPVDVMEFYLSYAKGKYRFTDPREKEEAIRFLLERISEIPGAIEREHWLQAVSDISRLDIDFLKKQLPTDRKITVPEQAKSKPLAKEKANRHDIASEFIIGLIIASPHLRDRLFSEVRAEWISPKWRELYKKSLVLYTSNQSSHKESQQFLQSLSDEAVDEDERQSLRHAYFQSQSTVQTLPEDQMTLELSRHIQILQQFSDQSIREDLEAKIREAERQNDQPLLKALLDEYSSILKRKKL